MHLNEMTLEHAAKKKNHQLNATSNKTTFSEKRSIKL